MELIINRRCIQTKKIILTILFLLTLPAHASQNAECPKSGGYAWYGLITGHTYVRSGENTLTQINFQVYNNDGRPGNTSVLVNELPANLEPGMSIDSVVRYAYLTNHKITIWCYNNNNFSSVKFDQ